MLNQPPINDLEQKAGCRYLLVTAVAKRARKLMEESKTTGDKKLADNEALARSVREFYYGDYEIVHMDGQDD